MPQTNLAIFASPETAAYGFGGGHPFGPDRFAAFAAELAARGLDDIRMVAGESATEDALLRFHTPKYLSFVARQCEVDAGFLDDGDTPAQAGMDQAARAVCGATLAAADAVMSGECQRAFVPIGGLHHAGRDRAAGFCVLSDIGVVIEHLRTVHGLQRIAYVDIDVHHGDGVFYAYEDDPNLIFADTHEDGRFLYPGTGRADETGQGEAAGTKLNIPLPQGADDTALRAAWEQVEKHLRAHPPEFILFQCGADSLAGDPLAHLAFTEAAHGHAAARLAVLADEFCNGRLLGMGGGGYNRPNLAAAWCAVVAAWQ